MYVQVRVCDLQECQTASILDTAAMCGCVRCQAVICGSLCPIHAQDQDQSCRSASLILRLANRAPRKRLPSSRRSSIEPRKITVKSAVRASPAMAQAPLLTLIFHGSFGAYREDGDRVGAPREGIPRCV
jgi:hypothetical protein